MLRLPAARCGARFLVRHPRGREAEPIHRCRGRKHSGNVQQLFYVPDGATRLYLGIADGGSFQGNPDFYSDNLGTYTARFDISTTVPEPSSVVLIATGLAALFVVRRRRRVF